MDRRLFIGATGAALSLPSFVHAQGKPIRLIVPFAAGGATDVTCRLIAEKAAISLGQPVLIENRPGGGGNIGVDVVAKAAPDGHTIVLVPATHAINVSLYGKLPFDVIRDFTHVSILGDVPNIMIVNPKVEAKTAQEFVALCKRQPGRINFGSGSASTRISGELLKAKAGIDMLHVPYKSTPAALQDTMAGHVQMCFADPVTSLPQVKAGTVRCLGVGSRGRYKLTPDIPTIIEQGIPDFELMTWTGILMPRGVPQPVMAKLREAMLKAITDPAYVERQAQGGSEIAPCSPDEMRRIMVAEIELYREMMKVAGIEPE